MFEGEKPMDIIRIFKHDHSLLFPRVAESLSTKSTNSYLQLPLGAPTLCSLAKPTGTESPPVSPEATSAKPDVPQARILMRGKPSFDSLQSYNVVSLISHPREIEPRIRKKEKLNLSACPSSWLHSFKPGLKGGRGRAFEPNATWNIQLFRV